MGWNQNLRSENRMDGSRRTAVQIILLSLTVCAMVWGIYRGEMPIVLNKAVNVCLECIGLG